MRAEFGTESAWGMSSGSPAGVLVNLTMVKEISSQRWSLPT
jgi:hypothetical protein